MQFGIGGLRFTTTYWYGDVDLLRLEDRYGREFMEKLYFHIAAFEANKLTSLLPERFDLGPFRHLYTDAFEALWRRILHKVWAQWRYENAAPHYRGPAIVGASAGPVPPATSAVAGPVEVLLFCGGGKDSLVAMQLLERAGIEYASYAYAHSIYGTPGFQHHLIEGLLRHFSPVSQHRHWVFDDFLGCPFLEVERDWGVKTITAAETPSSVFGALPLVLEHGYKYLAVGHERSADVGNLVWGATGEEVNHQWGKSLEAELLLSDYLRRELIANVSYFSVLKPIYDVLIFNLLRRDLRAVPAAHSCNIRKPWCGKCPKCAYVWLNYMAYLPVEVVNPLFGRNLFEVPENERSYRQMLGLEEHTPFECIGQIPEAQLAFELCRRKGLKGRAMDVFANELTPPDIRAIGDRFLTVNPDTPTIPPHIAAGILPLLRDAAEEARLDLLRLDR